MSKYVQHGVNTELEAAADQFLKDSFADNADPAAKSMILTRWMLATRLRREVYTVEGTPDASVRRGLFHRVRNPVHHHLNAVDGVARPKRFSYKERGVDE